MSNKLGLIKQINDETENLTITEQTELSEADQFPSEGDIKKKFGSLRELQRIASYWKENGQGLEDDELREKIGMDLEQLEYTPDQQADAIPKIMDMVKNQ